MKKIETSSMPSENHNSNNSGVVKSRRQLLGIAGVCGAMTLIPSRWAEPIVNSIMLPAHAQTSPAMCVTDTTIGGPLLGNPSGAATCQAACEAEANSRGAQLCDVVESVDASGATQCDCELDLP